MTCINWVSIWRKCFNHSMGLEDFLSASMVIIAKELIALSVECFILGTIILVLHVYLSLAPRAEGLIQSDSIFREAGSTNARECFLYAPLEYCPVFCGWFWKA